MRHLIGAMVMLIAMSPIAVAADDEDIIFAPKSYYDAFPPSASDGFVAISGTLTGDGVGYRNNTYSMSCWQERRECFVSFIEQIGPKQIGRMDGISIYPIIKWTAAEVVASDDASCSRTTITITRKAQSVFWVVEPINQARPECAKSQTKIFKWTIEDSLGWKRMHSR